MNVCSVFLLHSMQKKCANYYYFQEFGNCRGFFFVEAKLRGKELLKSRAIKVQTMIAFREQNQFKVLKMLIK